MTGASESTASVPPAAGAVRPQAETRALTSAAPKPARRDLFDHIEMFYNPRRRRGSNGELSPVEFEQWSRQSGRVASSRFLTP